MSRTIEQSRKRITNGLDLINKLEQQLEIWEIVEGFENYSVSSFGRIRNNRHYIVKYRRIIQPKLCSGYHRVTLHNKCVKKDLLVHRIVADAFITNPNNKEMVDHIDNNPLNNHMHNLRRATNSENQMNRSIGRNNTSGTTGVQWKSRDNRWIASITCDGIKKHLGSFITFEEAQQARISAANKTFGEYTHISVVRYVGIFTKRFIGC
jgi:hypothetical protein